MTLLDMVLGLAIIALVVIGVVNLALGYLFNKACMKAAVMAFGLAAVIALTLML